MKKWKSVRFNLTPMDILTINKVLPRDTHRKTSRTSRAQRASTTRHTLEHSTADEMQHVHIQSNLYSSVLHVWPGLRIQIELRIQSWQLNMGTITKSYINTYMGNVHSIQNRFMHIFKLIFWAACCWFLPIWCKQTLRYVRYMRLHKCHLQFLPWAQLIHEGQEFLCLPFLPAHLEVQSDQSYPYVPFHP